jgi:hypothetical protein
MPRRSALQLFDSDEEMATFKSRQRLSRIVLNYSPKSPLSSYIINQVQPLLNSNNHAEMQVENEQTHSFLFDNNEQTDLPMDSFDFSPSNYLCGLPDSEFKKYYYKNKYAFINKSSTSIKISFFSLLHKNDNAKNFDACIYFFSFCHRFKLSLVAQDALLKMIHFMLPIENSFPKTINKLKAFIGMDKIDLHETNYCEKCHHPVNTRLKYIIVRFRISF